MQTSRVELAGYVRLHGELSVLGLISASLTFNLQLAYHKETGQSMVWGEATLDLEVEVLFFSAQRVGAVPARVRRLGRRSQVHRARSRTRRPGTNTATRSRRRLRSEDRMAKQSLLWTALPNGYAADGGSLRVSVLVSPRLEAEADPEQLGTFPDFEDWPATVANASFTIRYGGGSQSPIAGNDTASPSRVDTSVAARTPPPGRRCSPRRRSSRLRVPGLVTTRSSRSPPRTSTPSCSRCTRRSRRLPANSCPTVSDFLDDPGWQRLVEWRRGATTARSRTSDVGVRDPKRQFDAFTKGQFEPTAGGREGPVAAAVVPHAAVHAADRRLRGGPGRSAIARALARLPADAAPGEDRASRRRSTSTRSSPR